MQPIELLTTAQKLTDFSETDSKRLMQMGPLLTAFGEQLANMFYSALDTSPVSKAILDAEPNRRIHLRLTLMEWFEQIFSGKYDAAYAQRRWIIGLVHVRIGIPPMFVVGSIENVYRFSAHKLVEMTERLNAPLHECLNALNKMLYIDLAFIEQCYAESSLRAMSNEMGADAGLVQRFASKGASELLDEARQGKFS
jgi:hypothetical protein